MIKIFESFKKKKYISKGPNIDIRHVIPKDYKKIYRWFLDRELMEHAFGIVVDDKVIDQISQDYFKDFVNMAVNAYGIETKDGLLIGFVRFSFREDYENYIKIGILIGEKSYWGKGYGSEAMKLSIDSLFKRKNINRIELDTAQFNSRAQRCFEKSFFKKTGEFTEVNFLTGEMTHKISMCITKKEYLRIQTD